MNRRRRALRWATKLTLLTVAGTGCGAPENTAPATSGTHSIERADGTARGVVVIGGVPTVVEYAFHQGHAVLEGDIYLPTVARPAPASGNTDDGIGEQSAALTSTSLGALWPNARIPFELAPELDRPERLLEAIAHWEAKTHVRFVRRTNETDHLHVTNGSLSASLVGHVGGMQEVTLSPDADAATAIHELGHAVGLWHEQSRVDRGEHINILWENIEPGMEYAFNAIGEPVGAYDIDSVMHYPSDGFSVNGLPTLTRKDGSLVYRALGLSPGDLEGIAGLDRPRSACSPSGAIGQVWNDQAGVNGMLGRCITPEAATTDGVGRFVHFENGSIFSSPRTGAHSVWGKTRDTWALLGWEKSALGYPLREAEYTEDGAFSVQEFENDGAIYWDLAAIQAFEVRGLIRAKWTKLGGATGPLGAPRSNERTAKDGIGRVSHFVNGDVYFRGDLGAFEIRGALRGKWLELGGETGQLGYPVSDEIAVEGGRVSRFERGTLRWNAADGAITVKLNAR